MTPMYKTAQEMEDVISKYFSDCANNGDPLTVTGLALALGFTSRQALINYGAKDGFVDTVKKAKLIIENFNEKKLYDKNAPTAGVIFNLVNNYGWQNKYINENRNTNEEITKEELDKIDSVLDDNE